MLGRSLAHDSHGRPVECAGPLPSRREFRLRFADGSSLELGRRTAVMGVINATPDSFSDGGLHLDPEQALAAAARMVEAGVDLVDVGGESTRPGALSVDACEETRRVLPVVAALKRRLPVRVSVDTMKADVARRALEAGADWVNDVSAFRDPAMGPLVARCGVPVALMHMRGVPATMQRDVPDDDPVEQVVAALERCAQRALDHGIAADRILVDPGIGFGKTVRGNLRLLQQLGALAGLAFPVLVGLSRKSFIGTVLDLPVESRLEGSLAVAAFAADHGAHVIRTHDVEATVRAVRMIDAIRAA